MTNDAGNRAPGGAHDTTTDRLDRIAGTIVGAAVGDALGAPYEFGIPGPDDPQMAGGGIGPWAPGEWTDDTEMTICVAEAIGGGTFDARAVGERFLAWFASGPRDVGHQTRLVLAEARDAADLADIAAEHHLARPHATAGNGSLMRTAPVALAHLGDDVAIARSATAVSALTHGDPRCAEACVLWCIAIDRAITTGHPADVDAGLELVAAASRGQWAAHIEQARACRPSDFVPNGFVVRAFQAALAAVHEATDFASGLRAAVGAGHDTDTVGAIAGALLGARFGLTAIPDAWLEPLHGSPGLDADGLVRLAHAVARAD